jgi:hypothetical protein
MQWAIDNIDRLRTSLLVGGAALVAANLALGPDPFTTRIGAVLILIVVVPFSYFGMRWMLRVQIWQHGLRRWIVQFATLAFYFFGLGAIAGLAFLVADLGQRTPFAAAVITPAVFAYSAVDTISRARNDAATSGEAG